MTTAEKLVKVAENREKLYEAGKQAENDAFWDVIQQHGTRASYAYAFNNWEAEYIRPKYKVVPASGNTNQTFSHNAKLKKVEAEYFDFSQLSIPTNSQNGHYYTFYNCVELEEIEDINLQGYWYTATFSNCYNLHTIRRLPFREDTVINADTFNRCDALANVTIDGVIAASVNWQWCPFTKKSFESVFEHLSDTASGKTITFKKSAKQNAFTDAEWAALIGTKTNWTFSLV